MKYIKITLGLFVTSFVLVFMGVNAEVGMMLTKVQVPKLNSYYTSSAKEKNTWNAQYVYKVNAYNNNTNKSVDISARVVPQLSGASASAWVTTVDRQNVYFDSNSATAGSWKIQLKNKTSNITSSFFGNWIYNV